ncbi:hypothetical protein [Motilibacter deserti]|uniref:Integral membrane protein n=1 Tax=Motilibacter deserti TaxID=2714956 RepID=A0ABX0GU66_9ACTN|nr:hypothetical protein [Motilibacter deserti]NHC13217.1 hypothetical protein [Motilibacter deserti]
MRAQDPYGEPWTVKVVWRPRWSALTRRLGGWRRKRRPGLDTAADGWDVASELSSVRVPTGGGPSGGGGASSGGGGGFWSGLDEGAALLALIGLLLIGLVAAAALFWWLLLPLLLLLVDLVVVLVLLVAGVAARVVLRRPWTVEAASRHARYRHHVVGLRAARRARSDLAEQLRAGTLRPPVPAPRPAA